MPRSVPTTSLPRRLKATPVKTGRCVFTGGLSPGRPWRGAPLSVSFLVSCLVVTAPLAGCVNPSLRLAPEIPHRISFNAHAYERLSLKELRGKVVLLFFWTGSHIGCRSAVAGMNRLYERYRPRGLEIVGVHSPNWESFEDSASYVFDQMQEGAVKFPVIMDDDNRIKRTYGYLVVPSVFLVDRRGFIRAKCAGTLDFDHIGVLLDQLLTEDGRPLPAEPAPEPTTPNKRFMGYEEGPTGY